MDDHPLIGAYFRHIRARDAEALADLFTADAVMILPDGKALSGRDTIRAMYAYLFNTNAPIPAPAAAIAGPNGLAVEIEADLADGSRRRTANFFHLTETGLVHRLSVYRRGERQG